MSRKGKGESYEEVMARMISQDEFISDEDKEKALNELFGIKTISPPQPVKSDPEIEK